MPAGPVAVSAPGKVLLAGGYLVLDRAYTGLVFGLDARIHAIIQPISTRNGVVLSEIEVSSPQFAEAVWKYGYRWTENDGGMNVTQLRAGANVPLNRNPFVETALSYVLSYIASVSSPCLSPASIKILADNDYYSTSSETLDGSKSSVRFHDFGVPLNQAHKTGLGSSAALVTALTAALLSYYLPKETFDITSDTGRQRLHNLAQAAHCAAQGKVGSGFDVASAVYGSCLYRRFSPRILSEGPEIGSTNWATSLQSLINETSSTDKWDTEIHRDLIRVPMGLRLIMCDVSCGSQTPGMVKKVLSWRKEKPSLANATWTDLHHANESLARELTALASTPSLGLERLRACFKHIRKGIRTLSEQSGVPIEPPSQTALLDACEAVQGVIGGAVPGAGGYDAVALLIEDRDETVQALRKLFAGWKFEGEEGSEGKVGTVSMLGVRQEMEGVRKEDVEVYREWME